MIDTAPKLKTKKRLAQLRNIEQGLISDNMPLGIKSKVINPEDITLMFASKMALEMLEQKVRIDNIKSGFLREYKEIHPNLDEVLNAYSESFYNDKKDSELKLKKAIKNHPMTKRLIGIKGLGEYSLGIIMGLIKDVSRFDTPSNLMVYAGIGVKYGLKVCKANINKIKEISIEREGREFKGYNTKLSGRMYVIGESLLKGRGFFKTYYDQLKERLIQRAINNGETFKPTPEEIKISKGKMKAGRLYMKGKKHQSIEAWAHSNAMVRVQRVLLHLIYKEWREYLGLEVRQIYPVDYLGHKSVITLDEVLAVDAK